MTELTSEDIVKLIFSCNVEGHAYIARGNEKIIQWLIENKVDSYELVFPEDPTKTSYLCELWSTEWLVEFRRRQKIAESIVRPSEKLVFEEIEQAINPQDEKKELLDKLKQAIMNDDMEEIMRISKLRKEKGFV